MPRVDIHGASCFNEVMEHIGYYIGMAVCYGTMAFVFIGLAVLRKRALRKGQS